MFINALNSYDTVTANGAVSHSTSGSKILDYFFKSGTYRGRDQSAVDMDLVYLFNEDALKAMKVVFYNRLVTRKIVGYNETEAIQKGQGQKDEFIKSLKWLEENRPKLLYQNLHLIPLVGCWKDLWYDSNISELFHYVDTSKVYPLIQFALGDKTQRGLIAKYLPKIRSSSNCTNPRHQRLNDWARGFCEFMGWTEKQYRKFKSNPENTAVNWQRAACAKQWDAINFNSVPGRALSQNATSFERNCPHFEKWILNQKTAKFTGYPYELGQQYNSNRGNKLQKALINAQFEKLLENGKEGLNPSLASGVWCALDTSGSMSSPVANGKVAALEVCMSLGIYFSSLIEGEFKDNVIMFDSTSRIKKLSGKFTDKWDQVPQNAMGSTNLQSVFDEIIRVRNQNPYIPVESYPKTILVVSDMAHNNSGKDTNYNTAKQRLASVGLDMPNIIWWQVNGHYEKSVPNKMNDTGITMLSGFDPTIISLILGGDMDIENNTKKMSQMTPYEQMERALNQEILNLIRV